MLIASLVPLLGGILLAALRPRTRRLRLICTEGVTLITSLLVVRLLVRGAPSMLLLRYSRMFQLSFSLDGLGKVFLGLMAFLWPLAVLYASEYMEH